MQHTHRTEESERGPTDAAANAQDKSLPSGNLWNWWSGLSRSARFQIGLVTIGAVMYFNAVVVVATIAFLQASGPEHAIADLGRLGDALSPLNSLMMLGALGLLVHAGIMQRASLVEQQTQTRRQEQALTMSINQQKQLLNQSQEQRSDAKFDMVRSRYRDVADDLKARLVGSLPAQHIAETLAGKLRQISTMTASQDRLKSLLNFLKTHNDDALSLMRHFSSISPVLSEMLQINENRDADDKVSNGVLVDAWVTDLVYVVMLYMATGDATLLHASLAGEDAEEQKQAIFEGLHCESLIDLRLKLEQQRKGDAKQAA